MDLFELLRRLLGADQAQSGGRDAGVPGSPVTQVASTPLPVPFQAAQGQSPDLSWQEAMSYLDLLDDAGIAGLRQLTGGDTNGGLEAILQAAQSGLMDSGAYESPYADASFGERLLGGVLTPGGGAGDLISGVSRGVAGLPGLVAGAADALGARARRGAAEAVSFADIDPADLIRLAEENGGFTIDPRTGRPYSGAQALVGIRPAAEVRIPTSEATPERLREWVQANASDLGTEGRFMGGWVDPDGNLVLDVSMAADRPTAELLGRHTHQEAIFDAATGEVISLPPREGSLSPALRGMADSSETPLFHRKVEGPRIMARVGRIEDTLRTAFASPEMRAQLEGAVARGREIAGGADWYDTTQMRDLFLRAFDGDEARSDRFMRVLALFTAATSPNTPVRTNVNRGLDLTYEAFSGTTLEQLEDILLADPDATTAIFGKALGGTLRSRDSIRQAFESGALNGQKISTFFTNFLGNAQGVTVDTHNVAGLLMTAGMDYRTPQGREAIAQLLELNPPGTRAAFRDAGVTSWADADPAQFRKYMYERISQGAEYGAFERIQQELAESMGLTPREFQAQLWVGMGSETGVRSSAPFAQIFMQELNKAARRFNTTPEDLLAQIERGRLGFADVMDQDVLTFMLKQRGEFVSDEEDTLSEDETNGLLDFLRGGF